MARSMLQAKQDAQEQRAKSDWLTFRGPYVVPENMDTNVVKSEESQDVSDVALDRKLARHIAGMISKRIDIEVEVQNGDITYVGVREANENHPKFILARFQQQTLRDSIWKKRKEAKKNGIIIEEWLTDNRARLYKKCKELKSAKIIKDVMTEEGDIYAILMSTEKDSNPEKPVVTSKLEAQESSNNAEQKTPPSFTRDSSNHANSQNLSLIKKLVISDADYENLIKLTKSTKVNNLE